MSLIPSRRLKSLHACRGFPELNLTRENASEVLRELQAKRQSLSDNDPGLPKIVGRIAWVKKYLEASLLTAGLVGLGSPQPRILLK
jgi:hypothetical protein